MTVQIVINFTICLPQKDRVDHSRKMRIGTIEVVRRACTYLRSELVTHSDTSFEQANKKDTKDVTKGQYTMSTTKKGRVVETLERQEWCSIWQQGEELGRVVVEYRMTHSLQVSKRYIAHVVFLFHNKCTTTLEVGVDASCHLEHRQKCILQRG